MRSELKERIKRREDVLDRVIKLLIYSLQLDRSSEELDPDAPLFGTGLALDSVDAVEIVVALDLEFDLSLDKEKGLFALRTINSIVDEVLEREKDGLDPRS